MTQVKLKGNLITVPVVRDSFYRRATLSKNKIIQSLRHFGLTEDHIEIDVPAAAMKNLPAHVVWYMNGERLQYTYDKCSKFAENLAVIRKVIELEVQKVVDEEKMLHEFVREFKEEEDVVDQRVEARKTLGLSDDETDMKTIDLAYKKLSKSHHPDLGGDIETFQEINIAHKILRRELS